MGSEQLAAVAPARALAADDAAADADALADMRRAVYHTLAESHEIMRECQVARRALRKTLLWSRQLLAE